MAVTLIQEVSKSTYGSQAQPNPKVNEKRKYKSVGVLVVKHMQEVYNYTMQL